MREKNDWEEPRDPWIGVDMDGTLARYEDKALPWNVFGPPITRMQQRVKAWVADKKRVMIVTARVFPYIHGIGDHRSLSVQQRCLVTGQMFTIGMMRQVIRDYTEEHIGVALDATCAKDYRMLQLWDDRAIQVIPNTGKTLAEEVIALRVAEEGKAQG